MIKRAALARALALDPEIVFLDEPTSGLDPIGAGDFDELIAKLQRTLGLTVFMVTHDLDSLFSVCDRIAALGDGKILAAGPIETMLASDDPWVQPISTASGPARSMAGERLRRSMETRANYALIGAFTLAVIVAAFGFVFWFSGGDEASVATRPVVFSGSVSGLSKGSFVLFNGLRVGEVTTSASCRTIPGGSSPASKSTHDAHPHGHPRPA